MVNSLPTIQVDLYKEERRKKKEEIVVHCNRNAHTHLKYYNDFYLFFNCRQSVILLTPNNLAALDLLLPHFSSACSIVSCEESMGCSSNFSEPSELPEI